MGRFLTFVAVAIVVSPAAAQVRDRAARPAAQSLSSDTAVLASGWSALGAGDRDAAARAAGQILARRPWDHAAVLLRIHAQPDAVRALDAYEQWLGAKRQDDPGLLEPVAIAIVQEIASGDDPNLKREALRALVAARVSGAREALDKLPSDPAGAYDSDVALARRGDEAALLRLNAAAASATGNQTALAQALRDAGLAGQSGLLMLLRSGHSDTRAAAAQALGRMHAEDAREPLKQLQQDPDPIVRTRATISLAQLGEPDALGAVDRMLASGVPDIQLAAAEAWEGRQGAWVPIVHALLDNRDGTTRVRAAGLIAPVDPEAARRTLAEALTDPNPVIRSESARVLADTIDAQPAIADIATLRQRLRDADRAVRLAAASALLRLARA